MRRRTKTGRLLAWSAALLLAGCAFPPRALAEPRPTPTPAFARVIVRFRSPSNDPAARAAARAQLLAILPTDGFRLTREYSAIAAVALEVSPAGLEALRASPLVESISADSLAAPTGTGRSEP